MIWNWECHSSNVCIDWYGFSFGAQTFFKLYKFCICCNWFAWEVEFKEFYGIDVQTFKECEWNTILRYIVFKEFIYSLYWLHFKNSNPDKNIILIPHSGLHARLTQIHSVNWYKRFFFVSSFEKRIIYQLLAPFNVNSKMPFCQRAQRNH